MGLGYQTTGRAAGGDEELMALVVARQQEAIQPLYNRYAPLIYHMAAQSLGPAGAEDVVQDVFLSVWRKAETFDPKRGSFRPWVLQIAHHRILNELRKRSRTPQLEMDAEPDLVDELPDTNSEPIDAAWKSYRREAIQSALGELPAPQRQALSLAFFEDLTHDQVANALNLPVGTVKTRIRSALRTMRVNLAPLGLITLLLALLGIGGLRYQMELELLGREGRALVMVTNSEVTVIHLSAGPGVPPQTHGSYRGKPGVSVAVIALENFPAAPNGETYQGWVLHQGTWTSLGTANPDAEGKGTLIGEGPELTILPEAVEVTLEPIGGSAAPTGPVIIASTGK